MEYSSCELLILAIWGLVHFVHFIITVNHLYISIILSTFVTSCRILLRWKRSTRARGDHAVEELVNALRGMGRHDIVAVIGETHRRNSELTPTSFANLHIDEDGDELHPVQQRHSSVGVVPIKQFTF